MFVHLSQKAVTHFILIFISVYACSVIRIRVASFNALVTRSISQMQFCTACCSLRRRFQPKPQLRLLGRGPLECVRRQSRVCTCTLFACQVRIACSGRRSRSKLCLCLTEASKCCYSTHGDHHHQPGERTQLTPGGIEYDRHSRLRRLLLRLILIAVPTTSNRRSPSSRRSSWAPEEHH